MMTHRLVLTILFCPAVFLPHQARADFAGLYLLGELAEHDAGFPRPVADGHALHQGSGNRAAGVTPGHGFVDRCCEWR